MKIKQFLKRIVAATLAATTMLTSFSIEAFAKGWNGGGGGSNNTIYVNNGVNESYWGYRFAVVDDKTGAVETNEDGADYVKDIVQFSRTSDLAKTANGAYVYNIVRTDKDNDLGAHVRTLYDWPYSSMPKPVLSSGKTFTGNGEALKAFMTSKKDTKSTWAEYIIKKLFGDDALTEVKHGNCKLVVEPVYLFPLYNKYEQPKDAFGTGVYTDYNDTYGYSSYSGMYFYGTYFASLYAVENLATITGVSGVHGGSGGLMKPAIQVSGKCKNGEIRNMKKM